MDSELIFKIETAVKDYASKNGKYPGKILTGRNLSRFPFGGPLLFNTQTGVEIPIEQIDGDVILLMPQFYPKPSDCPECKTVWNARGTCPTRGCAYSYSFIGWDVNTGRWHYENEGNRRASLLRPSPVLDPTIQRCIGWTPQTLPVSEKKEPGFLSNPRLLFALEVGTIMALCLSLGQVIGKLL